MNLLSLTSMFLLTCPLPVLAGTSDDCSMPGQIFGQGSFQWDSSQATTGLQGQSEALCAFQGQLGIAQDVWIEWFADATGMARASTCGTAFDTKVAVYASGGCPGPGSALACSDDDCGLQAEVSFPVVAGTTYLLQLGSSPSQPVGGVGNLDLFIMGGCPDDSFEPNDDCSGAPLVSETDYPGLTISDTDPDYYRFTLAPGDVITIDITFDHDLGDLAMQLFESSDCPSTPVASSDSSTSGSGLESVVWANSGASAVNYKLEVTAAAGTQCNDYELSLDCSDEGGDVGTRYCFTNPNSTGAPAVISAIGSNVVAENNLTFFAEPCPVNQFGLFYFGSNTAQAPFGDGIRCVAGGAGGLFRGGIEPVGGDSRLCHAVYIPHNPWALNLLPGTTWNFQAWFRDPAAMNTGFNLSDALTISFE